MNRIEENINLVYYVVNKEFAHSRIKEDLYQEGMIGLIKADKLFDENKGIKFSTYATRAIYNECLQYTYKNLSVFSIPRSLAKKKESLKELKNYHSTSEDMFDDLPAVKDYIENYINETYIFELLKNVSKFCNERDKQLYKDYIFLKLEGERHIQNILSKKYQIKQPSISKIINNINKKLREEVNK